MKKTILLLSFFFVALTQASHAIEMVIGEEYVEPGIDIIFEGAAKDHVIPLSQNLAENKTDVHIEARINWSAKGDVPEGTPRGGFIPYLVVHAELINQKTKKTSLITLLPHINLIDNFHYARNISLPGNINDLYTVIFYIDPPQKNKLSLHHDWLKAHTNALIKPYVFNYKDLNFEAIAKAVRDK